MTDNTPSRNEDEYFVKLDAELIKTQRAKLDADRARTERSAHYMKCPKCGANLTEVDFQHMKIDRCVECNGVWLDRGEIEMLEHVDQSRVRAFVRSLFGLKW